MKRFALALNAIAVTIAVAPTAYAVPDLDELRPASVEQDTANFQVLSREDLDEAVEFDELRRESFDDAASRANSELREDLEKDAIIDVFVVDL